MTNSEKQPGKSRALAVKLVFAALNILKEHGGELPGKQVLSEIESKVPLSELGQGAL